MPEPFEAQYLHEDEPGSRLESAVAESLYDEVNLQRLLAGGARLDGTASDRAADAGDTAPAALRAWSVAFGPSSRPSALPSFVDRLWSEYDRLEPLPAETPLPPPAPPEVPALPESGRRPWEQGPENFHVPEENRPGYASRRFAGLAAAVQRANAGGRPVSVLHYGASHVVAGFQQPVIERALEQFAPVDYHSKAKVGVSALYPLQHKGEWLDQTIAAARPDLVIIEYGNNEAAGAVNREQYARKYEQLVQEVMARAPGASILLVGPTDGCSIVGANKGNLLPGLDQVIAVQKEIAAKYDLEYFDSRQAMGGKGSVFDWRASGLIGGDLLHMTKKGYETYAAMVGRRLADNLRA